MSKLTSLVLMALLYSTLSCNSDSGANYGMHSVSVRDRKVYFKREVRGLNYDALAISLNSEACIKANPQSDYIFRVQGPITLFYKVDDNTLELYGRFTAAPPESVNFPVNIVQHELSLLEFEQIKERADQLGLKPLEVQINAQCK